MVGGERILDDTELARRNVVADETQTVRVSGADACAGQREIGSHPTHEPREEIGAADVGQKTDAHLRHGEAVAFRRHAVGPEQRDADAAAIDEPVDQRHVRPDEFL